MQAPRRLQLRRGNTAAISTYVGAPGELIVNTDTNALYIHNGVTVGGIVATVNTVSITSNISSLQGNITTLTANAGIQASNIASLTSSLTGANAAITTANTALKGYVDAQDTIISNSVIGANAAITTVSNSVIGANAAIVTANTALKGYVDSVANNTSYSNANVASYLSTYSGNIGNVSTTANVTTTGYFLGNGALLTGIVAGTTYSNTNVAAYLTSQSITSYANTNVASYLPTYSGNIANVRLGTSGNITFADGTIMTTAASGSSTYSNTNVASYLSTATITTTGNVTAANFIGNISITGNVTGTSPNVTLVAGSYSSVFNDQGNVILPNVYVSGNATVGNIAGKTNGFTLGYLEMPQVASGNVTLALSDSGKHFYNITASPQTITIPSFANVAFGNGTVISIANQSTSNISVALQANVILYLAGNATSAARTITSYGVATLLKVNTNTWFINGSGVA